MQHYFCCCQSSIKCITIYVQSIDTTYNINWHTGDTVTVPQVNQYYYVQNTGLILQGSCFLVVAVAPNTCQSVLDWQVDNWIGPNVSGCP